MIKKIACLGLLIMMTSVLCNCKPSSEPLRIGTISGPETQLMEVAKQVAKDQYNLNVEIVEFTDYVEPNTALEDGEIEANMFQHQSYLDEQVKSGRYTKHPLVTVAKTFLYPMGIYAGKAKDLNVANGAVIAIPNDPSNEKRALLLLQAVGLIGVNATAETPLDITSNPRNLQIKELDAAELPRSLPDVSLAIINTNYALSAGLPASLEVVHENPDSLSVKPYANIIVTRADDKDDPRIKLLVQAFQSDAVKQKAHELFGAGAIPMWG